MITHKRLSILIVLVFTTIPGISIFVGAGPLFCPIYHNDPHKDRTSRYNLLIWVHKPNVQTQGLCHSGFLADLHLFQDVLNLLI